MNPNEFFTKEIQNSAIAPEIAALNILPLDGDRALDAIFHSLSSEERRNDGRISDKWLRLYAHVREHGGLAIFGVDPEFGDRVDCISFKPLSPKSPDRKYENPPQAKPQAIYPAVTYRIMKLVSDRFGVPVPEMSVKVMAENPQAEAKEFWAWVIQNPDLPIVITEGGKKALAGISLGFPTIALTGIWNGVKAYKDDNGKTDSYELIPSLKILEGKTIYIAFDRDSKAKTVKNVTQARLTLAKLLIETGCDCYSMRWDSKDKGLDDLIVSEGVAAVEVAIANAQQLNPEALDKKYYIYPNILAEDIAKEWREWLCFDISAKKWKLYQGGVWQTKDKEEIENLFYYRVLEDVPNLKSFNYVIEVARFARGLLAVGKWDEVSSREYLPFANGVWSFADRVLLPHSPEYRLSWKLDRDYAPAAGKWQAIDNFLKRVTGGDEAIEKLLIAACAAVLQGRADLHKALYLFGEGRNGKGAFMRILEMLVGEENKHSSNLESLCENRFEISNLLGKRLVVCADEDPRVKRFSMFKKITGGDYLRGEDKGCKAFNFLFHGIVVLASNKPVFIGDDSYGLSDRLIPIPFAVTIPKEERRNLEPEFRRDLPSFTSYLLSLDREWVSRTLLEAKETESIRKLEWELEVDTNSVAAFYDENLIFDSEADIPCALFFKKYDEYCHEKGLQRKAENNFCKSLVSIAKHKLNLDVKSEKRRDGKHVLGLRFRADTDPFGDDVTAVTVKNENSQNIDRPVTTVTTRDDVTAVTVKNEFSIATEPKPPTIDRSIPTSVKVDDWIEYKLSADGDRIEWIHIIFHLERVAKAWRQTIILWGGKAEPPHKVRRNGIKWVVNGKNLQLKYLEMILKANIGQPPAPPSRR